MTINEEIKTILHYKDVSLIAVGLGKLKEVHEEAKHPDKEIIERITKLINRLGEEVYSYPKDDFTKK